MNSFTCTIKKILIITISILTGLTLPILATTPAINNTYTPTVNKTVSINMITTSENKTVSENLNTENTLKNVFKIEKKEKVIPIKLLSTNFAHMKKIPEKHTCKGENTPPQLDWSIAPKNTKSFVLIMDNPQAPMGMWVHWVVWNIPKHTFSLPSEDSDIKVGLNDYRKQGYSGPCEEQNTNFYFTLYALDTILNIPDKSQKGDVMTAMKGHIITKSILIGTQ